MTLLMQVKNKILTKIRASLLVCGFYTSQALCLAAPSSPVLPALPTSLSTTQRGVTLIDSKLGLRTLTIIPSIQRGLEEYIIAHGNPIAAAVVVDAASGRILALAQGKSPAQWGGEIHTALNPKFPAASLFKVVTTLAALEIAKLSPMHEQKVLGGCANVHPRGAWFQDASNTKLRPMNLTRAFADSCNSFYAKMTLEHLGLTILNSFAEKLGWKGISSDFYLPTSPINPPQIEGSGIYNVGRYAAGFGYVGISPVHAAWLTLIIANGGKPMPLQIFSDTAELAQDLPQVFSVETSAKIRAMMQKTVQSGTASSAFRPRAYRMFKNIAGGKTGTLTGSDPKGLSTWFIGLSPVEQPEVIVSALVVNNEKWVIKGSQLAAEAFRLWYESKIGTQKISHTNNRNSSSSF